MSKIIILVLCLLSLSSFINAQEWSVELYEPPTENCWEEDGVQFYQSNQGWHGFYLYAVAPSYEVNLRVAEIESRGTWCVNSKFI